ncbi:MAG TPA: BACON domain-containing carbohydrate-binding protein [Chthoniobacterales bacterium]|nr:BACON domain-containing carbohydrate-binding protein [Chthoniobacterales bacterium]
MKSECASRLPQPALQERRGFGATLIIALFAASVRCVIAQGSPDIVWQGSHAGAITYTAFSPDGAQLASGGDDRKNNLWQATDGKLIRSITQCSGIGCRGSTFGFFSSDSQQLATAGVRFWNVGDGTLARTVTAGGIIALSPDWQYIASSVTVSNYPRQTRSIALFRSDGSQVWKNESSGGGATVFFPDGQSLATIGFAGIDILRVSDGSLIRNIVGPRGVALAMSHDGQFLATNGGAGGAFQWDDTIKIYRVSDGALVRTFTGTGAVTSIVFTPDDQTLIASSWDDNYDSVNGHIPATGSIRFWRLSDGALFKTYDQNTGTYAKALSVSPDGQLFSYGHDSTVIVARIPSSSCAASISPGGANLPRDGGNGVVNVTAPAGCEWKAVSRVSWITVDGPASGTGNGVVNYTAHGGSSDMTGLLIVAEQTFPIRLGDNPCSYYVSPDSSTWSSDGGTGAVGVQSPGGCGWTAASNDDWISITKISRDNGGGGVTYSVAPNPGGERIGTLTVAGQRVTIYQTTNPCTYTITPTEKYFGSGGGSVNIDIATTNGCPWTATTDSDWMTLGAGNGSGSGPATITVWTNANETTATRIGHVTVAGQVLTITQDGIYCSYNISPTNRSFAADGGSAFVNMAAADACSWSATSNDNWITITSGASGSGYGTIYYSVGANRTGSPRTGTLSIAGQTFTITQTAEAQAAPDILWTGTAHTAQVNAVAFSPDGELLASASNDHTVKLWRVADGALLATLSELPESPGATTHIDAVNTVAFSHDGTVLASGSMDRKIKLWRVTDRSLLRTMGGNEFILGVTFSPDDQLLASAGGYSTNEIKIWRLSDGENTSIIDDNLGATNAIAYSPDGQFLAAAKANSVATLLNTSGGNAQRLGHDGAVNFVAFSPGGQTLATASDDQSARLWQTGNNFPSFTLNGPSGFVKSVGFSPDGETLIAAGQDYQAQRGTILFWRASDGALLKAYDQETSTAVLSAQFSPDGRSFAYGLADGRVVLARNSLNAMPEPTPSPTPVVTSSPSPTPTPPEPTPTVPPAATPTPTPSPTASSSPSPSATPEERAQPLNIATRGHIESGDNAMIGGFIITGAAEKKVVVRAIGPSLQNTLPGALADPILQLHASDGALIRQNDNWKEDALQAAELEANHIAPGHDLESAIVVTLRPGIYTAMIRGRQGGSGLGLVEVYDLSAAAESQLANISTRGLVASAENVLIGGFILGGTNNSARILVRAIGPSLVRAGVTNALPNPTLELHDGNGALLVRNDDWKDRQQTEIEQTGLAPNDPAESAILADLAPGTYTAVLAGGNDSSGVGLIEVYNLR